MLLKSGLIVFSSSASLCLSLTTVSAFFLASANWFSRLFTAFSRRSVSSVFSASLAFSSLLLVLCRSASISNLALSLAVSSSALLAWLSSLSYMPLTEVTSLLLISSILDTWRIVIQGQERTPTWFSRRPFSSSRSLTLSM